MFKKDYLQNLQENINYLLLEVLKLKIKHYLLEN